jgi:hypothetical protein
LTAACVAISEQRQGRLSRRLGIHGHRPGPGHGGAQCSEYAITHGIAQCASQPSHQSGHFTGFNISLKNLLSEPWDDQEAREATALHTAGRSNKQRDYDIPSSGSRLQEAIEDG